MTYELSRPSVFISHSTKRPSSEAILKAVADRLKELGYEVLQDLEGIGVGRRWRPVLDDWMGRCDAAIILVSREALDSQWVRQEATILSWRKSLLDRFVLVTVLLDGLTEKDLAKLGPLSLVEYQLVHVAAEEEGSDVQPIVERVSSAFETVEPLAQLDDRMAAWVQDVAACLLRADDDHVRRAARLIGLDDSRFPSTIARHRLLALRLLFTHPEYLLAALEELAKSLPTDFLHRLVTLIEPNWIDYRAAGRIVSAARGPGQQRSLALNAEYTETADAFIRRGYCGAHGIVSLQISGIVGEEGSEGLVSQCDQAFCRRFHYRPHQVEKAIVRESRPFFLTLFVDALSAEEMERIATRYYKAVLLLLSGSQDRQQITVGHTHVEMIVPALRPEEEDSGDIAMKKLRELCKR